MIYFIQCGEFVKIGIAQDVRKRLAALQIGNPTPLRILGVMHADDDVGVERGLHGRFADARAQGEWFYLTRELCSLIEGSCRPVIHGAPPPLIEGGRNEETKGAAVFLLTTLAGCFLFFWERLGQPDNGLLIAGQLAAFGGAAFFAVLETTKEFRRNLMA